MMRHNRHSAEATTTTSTTRSPSPSSRSSPRCENTRSPKDTIRGRRRQRRRRQWNLPSIVRGLRSAASSSSATCPCLAAAAGAMLVFLFLGALLVWIGATTIIPVRLYPIRQTLVARDVVIPVARAASVVREPREALGFSPLDDNGLAVSAPTDPALNRSFLSLNRSVDYEMYTVRINTWKREEQLGVVLRHYESCPGVAEIQVVWCLEQGHPPDWLTEKSGATAVTDATVNDTAGSDSVPSKRDEPMPFVVLELHVTNSLNERFRFLREPPTAAVLTVDDDVMRPCEAMDVGFFMWTRNPDRMVGFDARTHVVVGVDEGGGGGDGDGGDGDLHHPPGAPLRLGISSTGRRGGHAAATERWAYGYLSTTEETNRYSTTLTRFAFVHKLYLRSYSTLMPSEFRDYVDRHKNCEDIAMSLWVSHHSGAFPPLLADLWAMKSQVKLYSEGAISGSSGHKRLRDECIDRFADVLHLKDRLRRSRWVRREESFFSCGVQAEDWNSNNGRRGKSDREAALEELVLRWKHGGSKVLIKELGRLRQQASRDAFLRGLIEGTAPWKTRFRSKASRTL